MQLSKSGNSSRINNLPRIQFEKIYEISDFTDSISPQPFHIVHDIGLILKFFIQADNILKLRFDLVKITFLLRCI